MTDLTKLTNEELVELATDKVARNKFSWDTGHPIFHLDDETKAELLRRLNRAEIEAKPVLRFRLRQYHETMLGETCWTADLLDTEGDPVFWWRSMGSSTRQGAIDSTNTMVGMVGLTATFEEAPRDE